MKASGESKDGELVHKQDMVCELRPIDQKVDLRAILGNKNEFQCRVNVVIKPLHPVSSLGGTAKVRGGQETYAMSASRWQSCVATC